MKCRIGRSDFSAYVSFVVWVSVVLAGLGFMFDQMATSPADKRAADSLYFMILFVPFAPPVFLGFVKIMNFLNDLIERAATGIYERFCGKS